VLSPALLNNVRLQFQLASPITEFDPVIFGTEYSVRFRAADVHYGHVAIGAAPEPAIRNQRHAFRRVGKHQVKFGGNGILAHTGGTARNSAARFTTASLFITPVPPLSRLREPVLLRQSSQREKLHAELWQRELYGRRLVVVAICARRLEDTPQPDHQPGLRYERQTFTDSNKDFAPRAGFAYNWNGTVFRGSFGIYYSQIVDNSEANYALTGPTGVFNYVATPGQSDSQPALPQCSAAFPATAQRFRSLYVRLATVLI